MRHASKCHQWSHVGVFNTGVAGKTRALEILEFFARAVIWLLRNKLRNGNNEAIVKVGALGPTHD